MDLQGATALVTGASGLVGGHTACRLAEVEGLRVRALVRHPTGSTVVDLRHPNIELAQGDMLDHGSLVRASEGVDLVVHCAMSTHFTTRKKVWAIAVHGTRTLYEAARRAGAQCFIFLSSFSVYFGIRHGPFDEATLPVPSGEIYGDAKIATEEQLLMAAPGGPTVVCLRPPVIYGPGSWFWSTRYVEVAKQGRLFLPGGGAFAIVYTYIDNLIDAIIAAARANVASGIYNILDGRMPYRDFVEPYARMVGATPRNLPLWVLEAGAACIDLPLRWCGYWPGFSRQYVEFLTTGYQRAPISAAKAGRDLGWTPRIDFETGIARTHDWMRQKRYVDE